MLLRLLLAPGNLELDVDSIAKETGLTSEEIRVAAVDEFFEASKLGESDVAVRYRLTLQGRIAAGKLPPSLSSGCGSPGR
jgi:hypothetical protein